MKRPVPPKSGWVNYVAYKLRPEYKVMGEANRFQLAAFLVEILESPHDRVDVDCYSTIGLRSDCDFFIRYVAPTPEELQEICVKVNRSGLGRFLETPHSWLGLFRESPYPAPELDPEEEVPQTRFLVVQPFQKKRDWYFLPEEERSKMMKEHMALGAKYPQVHATTAYSFGLGDQDWVLSFEVADLQEYEKMAREMRQTQAARFTLRDTPVLLGSVVSAHEALELCGAL